VVAFRHGQAYRLLVSGQFLNGLYEDLMASWHWTS
jgi:hypothetical protein